MKTANILLIHPPVSSPAVPPWETAFLAGFFSDTALVCHQYDANLDFYLTDVLSESRFPVHWETIRKNAAAGIIPKPLFSEANKACQRIEGTGIKISSVKTNDFYSPENFIRVKHHINDLLNYFSTAFYPFQTGWGFFYHDQSLIQGSKTYGPFQFLCQERLKQRVLDIEPDMIVLFVTSPFQAFAGNVMAASIKEDFPEKKIVLITGSHVTVQDINAIDHYFSLDSLHPFFKLIQTVFSTEIIPGNIWPVFENLPLARYLTPQIVLPVNLSVFKNKKSCTTILRDLGEHLDTNGFMIQDYSPDNKGLLGSADQDIFFSISQSMDDTQIWDDLPGIDAALPSSLKMICWDSPKKENRLDMKPLWNLSKLGLWNHIRIHPDTSAEQKNDLFSFISSNPNIVQSFENFAQSNTGDTIDKTQIDSTYQPYAKVASLPGKPFWKTLEDPVYQLLYLNRYNKKDLFCMRTDHKTVSVIRIGDGIQFCFKKPDDLPAGFLDEICKMVEAGGSVDTTYVRYNLERAYLIGYAMENGVIIGNSSLKHPRPEFMQRMKQMTGLNFTGYLERGYTSVRPEYRALGVGAKLLEGLTERACDHKIFSIISEDNLATQKIALRNNTKKIATYFSEKAGKSLGVWMPENMIEKDWDLHK